MKFSLEQATKAHGRSRGIGLLFLEPQHPAPVEWLLGKRPSSHSTGAGWVPTGNWSQTVHSIVSRYTDYAVLAHNYCKGRNIIYILTCHLFYYNAVSSPNYKVSDSSIITGNVGKQWRIENKMMHIDRHMERLDNTVNELDGVGRNKNQCGYGGKRTMDNALQESKLSYNQQANQWLIYHTSAILKSPGKLKNMFTMFLVQSDSTANKVLILTSQICVSWALRRLWQQQLREQR